MAKPHRKKKIVLFISIILAGCIFTGVWLIGTRYDFPIAAREYDKVLADYRKAGFYYHNGKFSPTDQQEPGTEVANAINEAYTELAANGYKWMQDIQKKIDKLRRAKDYKGLLKEVEQAHHALALMAKAAEYENSYYPPYADIQPLGDLLMARAEARAGLKDTEGALKDLRVAAKLGDISNTGWTSYGHTLGLTVAKGTLRCALLLQSDPKALSVISDLVKHMAKLDMSKNLRASGGILVEMAQTADIDMLEGKTPLYGTTASKPPPTFWDNTDRKIIGWIPADMRRKAYVTRAMQLILESDRMYQKIGDDLKAIDAQGQKFEKEILSRSAKSWGFLEMFGYGMRTAGSPSYINIYGPSLAELRTIVAGIQALAYKHQNGSFPTDASQLPGELNDPFTNQPLKLKQTPNGLVIYSVGLNMKDDQAKSDDIRATVP